jgi:hypothetical protein
VISMGPSVDSRPTRRAALCHEAWGTVWLGLCAPPGCQMGVYMFRLRSAVPQHTAMEYCTPRHHPTPICAPTWWVLDIFRAAY